MSVFKSTSLSQFLNQYVSGLPKRGRGEISRLAHALGVSTTLVSQVRTGAKVFTPEQTHKLNLYLAHSRLESDYLNFLVMYERSGSRDLKAYWKSKLDETRSEALKLSNRVTTDRVLSDHEKTLFYSNPLYTAIRLFTSTGGAGRSADEIAERFELPRAKAIEILRFLAETGLCLESDGKWTMLAQKTHLEAGSPHLLRHHANWRLRAIRAAEDLSSQELMFTSPVSLSREDFELLREKMVKFIQAFLAQVHASPAEEIACFNLDFFWIRK